MKLPCKCKQWTLFQQVLFLFLAGANPVAWHRPSLFWEALPAWPLLVREAGCCWEEVGKLVQGLRRYEGEGYGHQPPSLMLIKHL